MSLTVLKYKVVFLKCRILGKNVILGRFFGSKHVILGHFGSEKANFDNF